jgi:hypothetical protein
MKLKQPSHMGACAGLETTPFPQAYNVLKADENGGAQNSPKIRGVA